MRAKCSAHMFEQKADGLRPHDGAAHPRRARDEECPSFPRRGKLGTRAGRAAARMHARPRVGITQRAFLHLLSHGCMKFTYGRLASHSRLNFSSSVESSSVFCRAPMIFPPSRAASIIHAIFMW